MHHRFRLRPLCAALAMGLSAATAGAATAPAWSIRVLAPAAGYAHSYATAINDAGVVAGFAATERSDDALFPLLTGTAVARIWAGNQAYTLAPRPGDIASYATAINNDGLVVGNVVAPGILFAPMQGFSSTGYGPLQLLPGGTLPGVPEPHTQAMVVDGSGRIYGSVGGLIDGVEETSVSWLGGQVSALALPLPHGVRVTVQIGGANSRGDLAGTSHRDEGLLYRRQQTPLFDFYTVTALPRDGYRYSSANALNNVGDVLGTTWGVPAGCSGCTAQSSLRLWKADGSFVDLAQRLTDSGADRPYIARGLNDGGVAVGAVDLGLGSLQSPTHLQRAFIATEGRGFIDISNLPAAMAAGFSRLSVAAAINQNGEIAGTGVMNEQDRGFVLHLDRVVWDSPFGGRWDDSAGWSYGIRPNASTDVVIEGRGLVVTGPVGEARVQSLVVGGGSGASTLQLAGGTLRTASGGAVEILAGGTLSGSGTVAAPVLNRGTVQIGNLSFTQGLQNHGLVNGYGTLNTNLDNRPGGVLQFQDGHDVQLNGALHLNAGLVRLASANNAHLVVSGNFENLADGRLQLAGGTMQFQDGLINRGQLEISGSGNHVFGAVITGAGGIVTLGSQARSSFNGTVEFTNGGRLAMAGGSEADFSGRVIVHAGAAFVGGGSKTFRGGLEIGDGPGVLVDGGNVGFAAGNLLAADIGGLAPGTGFDHLQVDGQLTFGGTLVLRASGGYTAQAGDRFDLFDWGSASGRFSQVDASPLGLAEGLVLDTSRLYIDGTVGVQAVPEPGSALLLVAGSCLMGWHLRRRRASAG